MFRLSINGRMYMGSNLSIFDPDVICCELPGRKKMYRESRRAESVIMQSKSSTLQIHQASDR